MGTLSHGECDVKESDRHTRNALNLSTSLAPLKSRLFRLLGEITFSFSG